MENLETNPNLLSSENSLHLGHLASVFFVALFLLSVTWFKQPELFNFSKHEATISSANLPKYYAYETPAELNQPLVAGASTAGQGPMIIGEDGSLSDARDIGNVLGLSTEEYNLELDKIKVNKRPALQKQLSDNGYSVVLSSSDSVPADLEIKGTATAYPFQTEGLGGFVSFRARLTVEATRPGTTKAVASLSKEASGLGGNAELAGLKSLETVGNLVGEELAKKLAENWSNKKTVFLSIESVGSFADVDRLKKHVAAQPGVKDLVLRTYDEGMAQFEVELGGLSSEELASRLEASQSLPLKVIEAKSQTIRLTTKK
jgi:hypothetical protein